MSLVKGLAPAFYDIIFYVRLVLTIDVENIVSTEIIWLLVGMEVCAQVRPLEFYPVSLFRLCHVSSSINFRAGKLLKSIPPILFCNEAEFDEPQELRVSSLRLEASSP